MKHSDHQPSPIDGEMPRPSRDLGPTTHAHGCAAYAEKAFIPELCTCGLSPATDVLPSDPPADPGVDFLHYMAEFSCIATVDEMRVLLAIARRLDMGRTQYGPLNLADDKRRGAWRKELREELLDAAVYGAILTLEDET